MEQGIMDNFVLPVNVEQSGAREAVNKLLFKSIGNDVAIMSGHEGGTPYRFIMVDIFNGKNSDSNIVDECVMPIYDDVEAVEFIKDRYTHPVIQVRHLSRDRLRFGADGEVLGGSMAEDYKRWKEGLGPKGTPLELWQEIGPGVLKTLQSQNIFTVEQFAAKPREWVKEHLPKNIQEIFEHLVNYVANKEASQNAAQYEARVAELEKQLAEAKGEEPVKRGPGRPKKID